jgi:hypothetical protein
MTDWQPIETVPKDGTPVDLWSDLHQRHWTDCVWKEEKWWHFGSVYQAYEFEPTYWMHPPGPPKL